MARPAGLSIYFTARAAERGTRPKPDGTPFKAQVYSPHLFRSALAALGSKFSEPLWFAISAFIGTVTP